MSTAKVFYVPPGTAKEEIARWKAANPGTTFVEVLPLATGEAPPPDLHRSAWSAIITWLKPLVTIGATILVPGVFGPAVAAALGRGLDDAQAAIDGNPVQERWTVQAIAAEVATLEDPRT